MTIVSKRYLILKKTCQANKIQKNTNKAIKVQRTRQQVMAGEAGPSQPQPENDTIDHKDRSSGRMKKAEQSLIMTSNPFSPLDVDINLTSKPQPHPKEKR